MENKLHFTKRKDWTLISCREYTCMGCGILFKPKRGPQKFCTRQCFLKNQIYDHTIIRRKPLNKKPSIRPWDGGKRPNFTGINHPLFGKKHTPEAIIKIKAKRALQGPVNQGSKHGQWKGGVSKIRDRLHMSKVHKDWIKSILFRDNYTCQHCGDHGVKFHIHHIIPYSEIRDKNNLKNQEDAINCPELWDINNGITLCIPCHRKTDNYGNKKRVV